jgi:Putative zinc-finger
MHLNEEQIQRFLHGELDEPQRKVLALHLAECSACVRQLEEAEREETGILDLLRSVDHPAPVIEAETLVEHRSGTFAVWGRRAAGFLVAAALAGAAYAFPGSPLPALLNHVAEWISGQTPPPPPPTPPAAEPSAPARPETAGIAVPVGERFSIQFTAEQAGGDVTVSLTDGPNVVARVFSGTATFTTDVDRLTIQNQGSTADYEIELPRDAPWVEISVGARRLILKEGERIAADVAADAQGRYVLSLSADPSHP